MQASFAGFRTAAFPHAGAPWFVAYIWPHADNAAAHPGLDETKPYTEYPNELVLCSSLRIRTASISKVIAPQAGYVFV